MPLRVDEEDEVRPDAADAALDARLQELFRRENAPDSVGKVLDARLQSLFRRENPTATAAGGEVARLRDELRSPRFQVPDELRGLVEAQRERALNRGVQGVSDALYAGFTRTPVRPQEAADPARDFVERRALRQQLRAEGLQDEERRKRAELEDPSSEASRTAREMFRSTETGRAIAAEMGEFFDRLPASKLPGADFLLEAASRQRQQQPHPSEIALTEARTDVERARAERLRRPTPPRKPRERAARPDAQQARARAQMVEVQDRYNNIKQQIAALKQQLKEGGTFELLGPHNRIMDQRITSIATDMAKLVDPASVARESEVAAFKKMLFEPGLSIRNDTALGVLDAFEKMVDERLESAYRVRGIDPSTIGSARAAALEKGVRQDGAAPTAAPPPNMPNAKRIRDPQTGRTGWWDGVSALPPGVEVLDG